MIHRGDLQRVLQEACRRAPGIHLHTSHRLVDFDAGPEGVTARFENGVRMRGSALIGADGLWSGIRAQLLADGAPRLSGHIAYRAVLSREQVPDDLWQNNVVLWAGLRTHLVHCPLRRDELFNLVAVFHNDKYEEGWDVYGDPEELRRKFHAEQAPVTRLLERIDTRRMWVLCDRDPVRVWSQGCVTPLGDAAHPGLRYMAQGANMAIEDAVVLAACVQHTEGDFARAFRWYQEERYLRTARGQMTSRYYGDIYHAAGVVRELRNLLGASRPGVARFENTAWLCDGIRLPVADAAPDGNMQAGESALKYRSQSTRGGASPPSATLQEETVHERIGSS